MAFPQIAEIKRHFRLRPEANPHLAPHQAFGTTLDPSFLGSAVCGAKHAKRREKVHKTAYSGLGDKHQPGLESDEQAQYHNYQRSDSEWPAKCMNSKPLMVSDGLGGPLTFSCREARQTLQKVSWLCSALGQAKRILADRGCDDGWLPKNGLGAPVDSSGTIRASTGIANPVRRRGAATTPDLAMFRDSVIR
jgi:hypothetical protein